MSIAFDHVDPGSASTLAEYDQTDLHSLLAPLLPPNCAEADRLTMYRFFNDQIKPTLKAPKRESFLGVGHAGDSYRSDSKRLPFCGIFVDYRKEAGVNTMMMDSDNLSGRFRSIQINLWDEPNKYE